MDELAQKRLEALQGTAQAFVKQVREQIDLMVQGAEDDFPAMGDVLAKSGIATHKQLELMEANGFIKSVTIDVPSRLVPTQTVKSKAYYTERRVPILVEGMAPQNKKKLDLLN